MASAANSPSNCSIAATGWSARSATAARSTDLLDTYPETFRAELLDVTDTAAIREVVDRSFTQLRRVDIVVSNAGYGLFGAAEELTDAQVDHSTATNLTGSIQLIRQALPHLRAQGGGRVIQLSSYGGQVAFPGNSMYESSPCTKRHARRRDSTRPNRPAIRANASPKAVATAQSLR